MQIRADFKQVETQIARLTGIGQQFMKNDSEWSNLKNREDWDKVYGLPEGNEKQCIERLYSNGRDIAIFMGDELALINEDYTKFPTLKHVVERFATTWVYADLSTTCPDAKDAAQRVGLRCWALDCMARLFEKQLTLLGVVRSTLKTLTTSSLYKTELEENMATNSGSVIIQNVTQSAISVGSSGVSQRIDSDETVFDRMLEAIATSELANKADMTQKVVELRESRASGEFLTRYQEFMAVAADHLAVFGQFLPALAAYLSR